MHKIEDLVYVGFNRQVAALDRRSGKIVWAWKSAKSGYYKLVSLLFDSNQLFVSVDGYTYCLDPISGKQLWCNELKGFGSGAASIATANANTSAQIPQAAAVATAHHQRGTFGTPLS